MGSEDNKYPTHLPPRYPSKDGLTTDGSGSAERDASGAHAWCGEKIRKVLPKEAGPCCGSFPRKGEVFAYAGSIQNLKDPKMSLCMGGRLGHRIGLAEQQVDVSMRLWHTMKNMNDSMHDEMNNCMHK